MIQRIETLIAAVALALAIGFGAGYYTRGQFGRAAVVSEAAAAVKQGGKNIVQSAEKSQQVEAFIQQSDSQIDQLKRAAADRLQKGKIHVPANDSAGGDSIATAAQATPVAESDQGDSGPGDRAHLDFGTVRLLNRARD